MANSKLMDDCLRRLKQKYDKIDFLSSELSVNTKLGLILKELHRLIAVQDTHFPQERITNLSPFEATQITTMLQAANDCKSLLPVFMRFQEVKTEIMRDPELGPYVKNERRGGKHDSEDTESDLTGSPPSSSP